MKTTSCNRMKGDEWEMKNDQDSYLYLFVDDSRIQ